MDYEQSSPKPQGFPALPATMSAQQVQTVLDEVAERRRQVQALCAQLSAFDEQLAVLEATLRPLVAWSRSWAELERSLQGFWQPRPPT